MLAPCNLKQIRKMVKWQFAVICGLPYFCGKMFPVLYPVNDVPETLFSQAMPQLFPKNRGMPPGQ